VALGVAALGIMNTMLMSVLERVREIGVMKAVGARDGHVLGAFLLEGALVGFVGGGLGGALGRGASLPRGAVRRRPGGRRPRARLGGAAPGRARGGGVLRLPAVAAAGGAAVRRPRHDAGGAGPRPPRRPRRPRGGAAARLSAPFSRGARPAGQAPRLNEVYLFSSQMLRNCTGLPWSCSRIGRGGQTSPPRPPRVLSLVIFTPSWILTQLW